MVLSAHGCSDSTWTPACPAELVAVDDRQRCREILGARYSADFASWPPRGATKPNHASSDCSRFAPWLGSGEYAGWPSRGGEEGDSGWQMPWLEHNIVPLFLLVVGLHRCPADRTSSQVPQRCVYLRAQLCRHNGVSSLWPTVQL